MVEEGLAPVDALAAAGEEAIAAQARKVALHRRFSTIAKEIWCMQPRFRKRRGQRALRLINERRFRAAYDFLLLRVDEEPELAELAQWWTDVQAVEADDRASMVQSAPGGGGKRRRRPRRRKPAGTT